MMRAPSTPGSSQTPYMTPCAGGKAANAGPRAPHGRFQAQKTTPKATAITAATTMSTVRQVRDDSCAVVLMWLQSGAGRERRT